MSDRDSQTPETYHFLLTPTEAAAHLRANPRTLERWRTAGTGPAYVKVGRQVRYRPEDLETYVERQVRTRTGGRGEAA
jgi:excisionase family DNA binding protein